MFPVPSSLESTVKIRKPSWVRQASLKHKFNAELRWVTRRPFCFRNWELVGDKATWSTFDEINGKDTAITEVTFKGRTFWVEAYRAESSDNALLIIVGIVLICTVAFSPLGLLMLLMGVLAPAETKLIFHTVDPRVHGRDPYTMTRVSSRKDLKRALEMRQPLVLTDI